MMVMEDEISVQVARLVAEAGLATIFPVPVEQIAEHLGFQCHFYVPEEDVNDIAGAVSHLKKKIYVNQNNSLLQQRLCIARKLACIVLHGAHQDYIEYLRSTGDPREHGINYFAENLLMPERIFKQKWFETNQNIDQLSQFFGVSQFVITGRASQLRLR